jgi:hypothetical protein
MERQGIELKLVFDGARGRAYAHPDHKSTGRQMILRDEEMIDLTPDNIGKITHVYKFEVDAQTSSLIPVDDPTKKFVRENDYGGERMYKAQPITMYEVT